VTGRSSALGAAREPREALWRAVDELEAAVVAPAPGRIGPWAACVTSRLDSLAAAWEDHVDAAERPGGLYEEVIGREPRLSHAVDRLKLEHLSVRATILEVRDRAREVRDDAQVAGVRAETLDLLHALATHRHRGVDLVYEAYNADISAGD
jgi:hypothetical protein